MARKPLGKGMTVAANVLVHGTGAINVDGCRVPLDGDYKCKANGRPSQTGLGDNYDPAAANMPDTVGRWPANLIHDGSDEVLAGFPISTSVGHTPAARGKGGVSTSGHAGQDDVDEQRHDKGSAARFFYCAKASRGDRNEGLTSSSTPALEMGATMREREDADWPARNGNHHPTVKPTDLMAYLCRLVTPPGGTVLDPFMGSGSTGKAAMREGFHFIGCELSPDYLEIARTRIEHERAKVAAARAPKAPDPQPDLFAA